MTPAASPPPPLNVLLVAVGSHGDVHPFVGLGRALRRRGHAATVITNEHFEPLVRKAGLEFGSIGTDAEFRQMTADPNIWHPTKGWKYIFEKGVLPLVPRQYDAVADRLEPGGRTVVVGSSLAFGARVLQEERGVPTATVHLSPIEFAGMIAPPRYPGPVHPAMFPYWLRRRAFEWVSRFMIDKVIAPPLNEFRATKGIRTPARRILLEWWNSPELTVGLFPAWFAPPQADWPPQTRLTGFPLYDESDLQPQTLSDELERFLAAGEPPIAFTPGSANLHGREFFESSAEACRLIGRRGVLLTRHREQVPTSLPPGVIHVDYAPFSALLPRCAALVHHGGVGTSAQGMAASVPQLVMPLSHDQPDNAERMRRLGVADAISPRRYRSPTAVAERLRRLLGSPDVARRCREVAGRFAGATPIDDTCDLIESMVKTTAAAEPRPAMA